MAEDSRDILMKLMLANGTSPPAECQALITEDDDLATGTGGAGAFTLIDRAWGLATPNYFSIDDYTFEVALKNPQHDAAKKEGSAIKGLADKSGLHDEALKQMAKAMPGDAGKDLLDKLSGGGGSSEFNSFILNGSTALTTGGNKSFVGDLADITITKRMDISSSSLLQCCLTREQFRGASVLKRKAVGEGELRTYMRIDFNQLMLTSFDWSDDDVVKETFKFVCRQAIVTYAVEDDGGNLRVQPTQKWEVQGFSAS